MIELRKNHISSFFQVPYEIYPKDFGFVSQLKSDLARFLSAKNPLFEKPDDFAYYTAYRDGKMVGRICAHIHRASNRKYNLRQAYFGYFDCIDDLEVAKALLQKVEEHAKAWDCNEVVGNFNLTAMQMAGVVTKINYPFHYSDQVYSPVYISSLLEKCGYGADFPMQTFEIIVADTDPADFLGEKQKQLLEDSTFTYKKLEKDNFLHLIEDTRICLNDGFSENPMFVPLTKEEILFQAKDLMLVVDRDLSLVGYHNGRPVGSLICIPNLNPFLADIKSNFGLTTPYYYWKFNREKDSCVIIFYSVCKDMHDKGLMGAMLYQFLISLKQSRYKKIGGTWIAESNKPSLRLAHKLKGKVMHELHLYRKKLVP